MQKWKTLRFCGVYFYAPKVSTSVFRRADAMTGVSWRAPPPRTGWLGQRCAGRSLEGGAEGGGPAERLGVRLPSKRGEEAPGQGHG